MTESAPFFDGPSEGEDEGTAPSSNRNAILAGGLAAALAIAAGGYFFLLGGSPDDDVYSAPPTTKRVTVTKTPVKPVIKKTPRKAALIPAVSTVPLGRDPFLALYVKPATAAAGPTTPTAPTSATAPTTGVPSSPPTTTPTKAPVAKTYALKLNRVYGSGKDMTAVFGIDGKTHLAKVGSVFGPTAELKMLSLQQDSKGAWVAVLQVGDGQPFDARIGQTLYVR